MRVSVIGAGPAGLYFAYRLKRRRPDADIEVFEQNSPSATFGFGVVFSDRALEFLSEEDPETRAAIAPHLESWKDVTIVHGGKRIRIDGIGFAAIGRLRLLQVLQERARSLGVKLSYELAITNLGEFAHADLVVGADGVNSLVRRAHANAFGSAVTDMNNWFAWFGTSKRFDTLTQTFCRSKAGYFTAHHYRYAPDMSTFLVEVDPDTFRKAGFNSMGEGEAMALCEHVFREALDGHRLVSNRSIWRRFPKVRNKRWSHKNYVLLGDALHTAHFSIGSGTRLAMEDAVALEQALNEYPTDYAEALKSYEARRRPDLEKLVNAAEASAAWYENFPKHMRLEPEEFAMSYITRSGRVDRERLRQLSPAFVAQYEQARTGHDA